MKKSMIRILMAAAAVLSSLLVCGCSAKQPEKIPDVSYTLTLEKEHIDAAVGEKLTLPAPAATSPDGKDVSDSVLLEVTFRDGSVYIPSHKYSFSSEFTPYSPGEYYAVYKITLDGQTVAKKTLSINATEQIPDEGIIIDGVLDEHAYTGEYRTGVDNNLLFKYRFTDKGIFVGVDVTDTTLIYNDYLVSRLAQSDGFEICFNFSGVEGDRLNPSCRKLRIGLNGEVYIYSPSASKSIYEINEPMSSALRYETRLHGTRSLVGSDDLSIFDTDTGYVFETFLSYAALGVEVPSAKIGIAFAHRDITSTSAASAILGGACNRYYSDVVMPDGIRPILSENGKDYEYCTYDHLALTCLYNNFYIGGSGIATPPVLPTVKIDGSGDDPAWSSALTINCTAIKNASVNAKAYSDASGLYVYAEVTDSEISTPALGDIFAGDCIQIRVIGADLTSNKSPEAGFGTSGKIITISPTGALLKSSLNPAALLYIGGFDSAQSVKKTDSGYSVELFIPSYELGGEVGGVCIGVIDNDSQNYAGENSMSYTSTKNDLSAYTKIGG